MTENDLFCYQLRAVDVSTGEAGTTTLSVNVVPCKLYYKKKFPLKFKPGVTNFASGGPLSCRV